MRRHDSDCDIRKPVAPSRRERGVLWVILLTFVMMVAEIAVGHFTHSMALLADGWHMATHVGALGITSLSYVMARRYATHRRFTFGTGKVHALGGFTSALALGAVAITMGVESVVRLVTPETIDYGISIPVAVLGLVVNLASVALLHDREAAHGHHDHAHHDHAHHDYAHHDHGHRAALVHVLADAFTSALAIVALSLGKWAHQAWLDPVMGIVGALVITKWGVSLAKTTAFELLDLAPTTRYEDAIRTYLVARGDVNLLDLHVWSIGQGKMIAIVTVSSIQCEDVTMLRKAILERFSLSHLTIELRLMR